MSLEQDLLVKPLTARVNLAAPQDLRTYEASGGYLALRKALKELSPADVQSRVKDSNLRGRGGAGFPTGVKWGLVPMGPDAGAKYLVCNADEMEPGTFKDRLLMEGAPHQMVEAMIVAGYAIGACTGYIFLRGEYVVAAERLNKALAEARAAGLLGQNILGSGWNYDCFVHTGAGRYICGEETALINSLEGRRANPRAKPPFPQIAGAWGRPTVVNNVESLFNIPPIVINGADWFKGLSQGKSKDGGTKLYGVSGRARRTGVYELPIGTSAREILEDHGGGMKDGYRLKAWLPGGASTDFLLPEHLDLAMDFDTIAKAGSRMGTGLLTVVDDKQNMVSVVRNLEEFFARESCGWCTPCRDGLPWSVKMLMALEQGRGHADDLAELERLTRLLGPGRTFCAHAPGAMEPLQSALKFFRAEFEAGVSPTAAKADDVHDLAQTGVLDAKVA
ncbi:NADH-quinone oxidoreductase subunit NuoF [Solimonas terrae]|uniref:NADH-quinone oxidoreductase subunit F n=1 Tax=Solimonas terrae TaxID=1396819 RepID=A0A6M2BS51_9GAMM|nr:NADH-quinone oxidoreductase subunit NuoF [Solimonas terrae]NGY05041.1 NADH-quinone oxidoreductase subunit NuoF [Solimonas terrae]